MKCIYCEHPYTYELGNQQRKCSRCKRKFSPQKYRRREELWHLFVAETTANQASRLTRMHIVTVQKHYHEFRRTIALESDKRYAKNAHRISGYDEYLYLPKSLNIQKDIDKLQHFLTLSYDEKVYNLMMPSHKRFGYHKESEEENRLLLKYLQFNKIAKVSKIENTMTKFWDYFEDFILKYKGVSDEEFIYYLKEAEWRFNNQ